MRPYRGEYARLSANGSGCERCVNRPSSMRGGGVLALPRRAVVSCFSDSLHCGCKGHLILKITFTMQYLARHMRDVDRQGPVESERF